MDGFLSAGHESLVFLTYYSNQRTSLFSNRGRGFFKKTLTTAKKGMMYGTFPLHTLVVCTSLYQLQSESQSRKSEGFFSFGFIYSHFDDLFPLY